MAIELISVYGLGIQQACKLIDLPRPVYYYQGVPKDDKEIVSHLSTLADQHPGYGFWKMYKILCSTGFIVAGHLKN